MARRKVIVGVAIVAVHSARPDARLVLFLSPVLLFKRRLCEDAVETVISALIVM